MTGVKMLMGEMGSKRVHVDTVFLIMRSSPFGNHLTMYTELTRRVYLPSVRAALGVQGK